MCFSEAHVDQKKGQLKKRKKKQWFLWNDGEIHRHQDWREG